MKNEVGKPVIVGVIVVVLVIVAVIGWKVFAPGGGAPSGGGTKDTAARDAHFRAHPADKAVFDSMNSHSGGPQPVGGQTHNGYSSAGTMR